MLHIYMGLVVSDKKIFENCILRTYFLTMCSTHATILTLLVGDQPGIIPVEFGQIPISNLGEVV